MGFFTSSPPSRYRRTSGGRQVAPSSPETEYRMEPVMVRMTEKSRPSGSSTTAGSWQTEISGYTLCGTSRPSEFSGSHVSVRSFGSGPASRLSNRMNALRES